MTVQKEFVYEVGVATGFVVDPSRPWDPVAAAIGTPSMLGFTDNEFDAVADARHNAEINGVTNSRFVSGDVRQMLAGFNEDVDVMVIDPPRAGMHQDVVTEVLQIGPQRIIYVSCNPSTLARDLALLKEKYHVVEVQPVDMFPHTWHIEAVACLEMKNAG